MSEIPQHISQHLRTSVFMGQELIVPSVDYHSILSEMDGMQRRFKQTFSNLNIVINFSRLDLSDDDATELLSVLKDGLTSIGHHIVGSVGVKASVAAACGIKPVKPKVESSSKCLMNGSLHKEQPKKDEVKPEVAVEPSKKSDVIFHKEERLKTEFIVGPIRGGKQLYAKGGSLVVHGDVKHGSEIAADGCITVFGKLEGRAHAGVKSPSATILATKFDPELVSVSGTYLANQDIEPEAINKSVLVQLHEDNKKLIVHLS